MERDPLMLNQRLTLMLTMDTMDMPDLMPMDTEPMVMDTHTDMDTMARDLLMPSQRQKLTQLCSTPPAMLPVLPWSTTPTPSPASTMFHLSRLPSTPFPWLTLSTMPLSTPQSSRLLPPPQLCTTLPSTTQLSTTLLSTPPSHSPTPWSTLFQLPPPLSPRERLKLIPPYVHHVAQPVVYNTAVHHPVTYAAPVVKAP